jgi:phosphonatase-like hydrolase
MIKMVVFDMAGTTVDEDNVVYKTVQAAINERGFQFSLDEVLAEGAGKEKLQAIRSVLALRSITDEQLAAGIFQRFKMMLGSAYLTQTITEQPYASKLFRELKARGILVVLDTGYDRQTASALIDKIGWRIGMDYDLLVTASDVARNRPFPDMILLAMRQFGIRDGSQVAKVGDSTIDVEEGRNAGSLLNIGITTGAHTYAQLRTVNPEYIVNGLDEILPIVERATALA